LLSRDLLRLPGFDLLAERIEVPLDAIDADCKAHQTIEKFLGSFARNGVKSPVTANRLFSNKKLRNSSGWRPLRTGL
jgi:hypothetical protein